MNLPTARALVDAHTERVRPLLSCRGEGCVGCCHGPILLSAVEWAAIKPKVTRYQRNAARLVAGRMEDYRCPMLDSENRCEVYEDRPLVCRSFNSTAPVTACYPGTAGRAEPEPGGRAVLRQVHYGMGVKFADCVELAWKLAELTDAELA